MAVDGESAAPADPARPDCAFEVETKVVPRNGDLIKVYAAGEVVGEIVVVARAFLAAGHYMSVEHYSVLRPTFVVEDWPEFRRVVRERLLAEVVQLADSRQAMLMLTMPSSSAADRYLEESGFRQTGVVWWRERTGS